MQRTRLGSQAPWEERVGYARAVRVGERIEVTGTTGLEPDGGHAASAGAQAREALRTIGRALESLGGRFEDVVRTRIYVTDIDADHEAVGAAHRMVFGTIRPATTMVEVRKLIAPWMKVEIEAAAVVGSGRRVVTLPGPVFRPAVFNETAAISHLLTTSGLPVPGVEDRPVEMFVLAARDEEVLGTVGVERSGGEALLRSLAVAEEARGRGHSRRLIEGLLDALRRGGTRRVWLLTLLEARFFEHHGFRVARQEDVPPSVRGSREFAIHACDAAQVLAREL